MSTRRIVTSAAVGALALAGFAVPASAAVLGAAVDDELADTLAFMREEERLAHDVYTLFAEKYPEATVFGTIATSEQRHADAVLRQLDRNGLEDPSEGLEPGDYAFADLDEMYAALVAQGTSLEGALQAGIAIEEEDIADLERILADDSSDPVSRVYEALLAGSGNHLAAFTSALENGGVCTACGEAGPGRVPGAGNRSGQGGPRGGFGTGSATCDGSGATR